MSGVATFNYTIWSFRYPELAPSVPPGMAEALWEEATLYVDNSPRSRIRDVKHRAIILGLVTAHIARLRVPINGVESSPLVGRINSASEGSVSVGTELPGMPGGSAWFAQTKYGLMAWQAMAQYRTAIYVRGPRPQYNGISNPWLGR